MRKMTIFLMMFVFSCSQGEAEMIGKLKEKYSDLHITYRDQKYRYPGYSLVVGKELRPGMIDEVCSKIDVKTLTLQFDYAVCNAAFLNELKKCDRLEIMNLMDIDFSRCRIQDFKLSKSLDRIDIGSARNLQASIEGLEKADTLSAISFIYSGLSREDLNKFIETFQSRDKLKKFIFESDEQYGNEPFPYDLLLSYPELELVEISLKHYDYTPGPGEVEFYNAYKEKYGREVHID